MNNLTRVLMGSASAAAILFGVQTGAQADSVSPTGGGTITYAAGGTGTDNTSTGGGVEIETLGGDTVNIDSVIIDKTASGPTVDTLYINSSTGALNVTFSGGASSLTEASTDGGAALELFNFGSGATTLDTTGAGGGNVFLGASGISVAGGGYTSVVLGADTINANLDGAGNHTFGLNVGAGGDIDISTAATIGNDHTHLFDTGLALQGNTNSLNTLTIDSVASISAATTDVLVTGGANTINNYGTLDTATKSIVVEFGANAAVNLFAGSTTGKVDLTGDGGGSIVSLYTGMGTDNVGLTDFATGAAQQAAGTLAAASFGTITGSGFDELDLRGAGDDTAENGAAGAIDLSSTGGISGIGAIGKFDSGYWVFNNGAGDAATNSSAGIFLEEGTIEAASAGAFGSGTIHVDNSGGFSLIGLSGTGTYGNDISLNVSGATLSTGAQIVVRSGVTATLSGAITSASANQTIAFIGAGTAVLTNTNNAWTGGTQISGGGTVSIAGLDNIGTGGITLGGSFSHGALQYTGTGAEESAQGLTIKPGGGTFDITDSGGELGFTGNITGNGTITKIGDGRLDLYHGDLTGHPNYSGFTGGIDVEAGSLYLSSNGSLTQGNNLTVASGALFVSGQGNQTIGVLSGAGEVDTGDGVFTVGSGITDSAQTSTFSGTIDSGADSTFEKTGAGTLVLSVTNGSAFNNIVIDQGTLALGASGDISNSNALSLTGASAIFDASITSSTPTVHNLSGVAGSQVKFGSKGLTVNQTGSTTFAGVISGSASFPDSVDVTGGGTLTLTGVNTYFAETIIESGTTLALAGNGSIANSAVDDVGTFDISATNNGATIAGLSGTGLVNLGAQTLTLANASNTFDGVIQGNGGLTLTGGTLTLSNVNTYSGTTEIGAGAGLTLTGNGSIANSSVNDLGTLDLTATTTAAGATIASLSGNGTVESGAATLAITNGAGEFSGVIDGTGGLTLTGGAETLSGANTYTGATTVTGGVLTAGTSAALNNNTVTLAGGGLGYGDGVNLADAVVLAGSNAQLQVNTGTATQSGAITETGGPRDLDKTGNGTLVVTTAVAYTGTTDVEAGTLRAGVANAFASSSNIIVAQGATLDLGGFNQSATELSGGGNIDIGSSQFTVGSDNASTTFSGVLSGTGSLVKTGTGTLTLSGDNTYSGGTTIQGGTIDAESDHAFGTGSITMEDPVLAYGNGISIANNLILAANDAQLQVTTGTATQAGVISQTGGARPLEKIGAGTLVLSATNTYTGATTVTAGTLDVTGSIASSSLTTVKSGATLTGSGTVGSASIASGATFTPSGTMHVNGNLTFASGSNYVVALSPASASQANVTGTAALGGAAVKASYGAGNYINKQYTIVTAGTVSGTFGSVTSANLPTNFSQSLSYDGQHAYIDLALSYVPPSPPAYGNGLTGNQNRVGNTLVDYFNTTGGIPTAFGTLTPAGLTAVSGEVAVAAAQTSKDAQEDFLNAMLSPSLTGRSGAPEMTSDVSGADVKPAQADGNPWHVWGGVFGGGRSTDGSASVGSSSTNAHNYGVAGGVDYIFNPGLLAGLAVSGGNTTFSVSHAAGSGKSDIYQIGAYAHQDIGTAGYITGALAYGSQDVTTHRTVDQSGVTGTYRGHYSSDSWSGRLEAGWRFQSGDWTGFTPFIAWQATSDSVPGYAEKTVSGSNTFALNYGGTDFGTSRGEIGLRADHTFQMDDGVMMLRGHAAWADNFQIDHAIDAGFQTLPGTGFTVQGAAEGRNAGLAGVSAEWKANSGMSLVGSVDGAFSNKSTAYVASGAVRYTW
ncbi:MAG TPA: autotransporter domain-containing protein [Rhizomicrobium sp.]|jgi:autotransporter-associated beta strand protein